MNICQCCCDGVEPSICAPISARVARAWLSGLGYPGSMNAKPGRFFLDKSNPHIWRALNGFGLAVNQAAEKAGVDRGMLELMYVRISQINGCVYCLDVHSKAAVKAGIPAELLTFLPAWRDTTAFNDTERAFLAVGEAATELPEPEQRRAALAWARDTLGDEAFGVVQWAAIGMNSYNRVSILSEHPVKDPHQ